MKKTIYPVDIETGEVVPGITMMDAEDRKRAKERYQGREEAENKRMWERELRDELGYFYFVSSRDRREALSPQSVARLMFLGTFLRYGDKRLYATERTPLQKKDLPSILKLKNKSFYRFWSEVQGRFLFEEEDGTISISADFFRGAIPKKIASADYQEYQKIYIDAMRRMYYQTPTTKHRYLGYIFAVLPFVNIECNILCWNPHDTTIENLQPITIDELCDLLNYDKSQRVRLLDAYKHLTFECEGKMQRFCSFVVDDPRSHDYKIFVNPRVMYRGHDWRRVEVLGAFF